MNDLAHLLCIFTKIEELPCANIVKIPIKLLKVFFVSEFDEKLVEKVVDQLNLTTCSLLWYPPVVFLPPSSGVILGDIRPFPVFYISKALHIFVLAKT